MVRSSAETRNSLLQLTKRVQIASNDQEAIDTGDDSAAPEDLRHPPAESVITQVIFCTFQDQHQMENIPDFMLQASNL